MISRAPLPRIMEGVDYCLGLGREGGSERGLSSCVLFRSSSWKAFVFASAHFLSFNSRLGVFIIPFLEAYLFICDCLSNAKSLC